MTATEIIQQIEALSSEEKALVVEYLHQLQTQESALNYAEAAAFDEAVEHVMTHHAPLMKKLAQ